MKIRKIDKFNKFKKLGAPPLLKIGKILLTIVVLLLVPLFGVPLALDLWSEKWNADESLGGVEVAMLLQSIISLPILTLTVMYGMYLGGYQP